MWIYGVFNGIYVIEHSDCDPTHHLAMELQCICVQLAETCSVEKSRKWLLSIPNHEMLCPKWNTSTTVNKNCALRFSALLQFGLCETNSWLK